MAAKDFAKQLKKIQRQATGSPPGHGPGQVIGSVDKPKHFLKSIKNLFGYIKSYKWQLLATALFAISSTIFAIVSPKILGNMTNQIVDDYVKIQAYDSIVSVLPSDSPIPPGTNLDNLMGLLQNQLAASQGQTIAKQLADAADKIPAHQLAAIRAMDLSRRPTINFGVLAEMAGLLVGLYILSAVFGYIQGFILTGVTQKIAFRFRSDISAKINRLPLSYFDSRPYGDVLSRITNDVDTIAQSLTQTLSQILTSITMIIGIIVMMLSIDWQLTGLSLLVLLISLVLVAAIIRRTQKYFKLQQDSLGKLSGHIEEAYAGHNVVKAFGAEQTMINQFSSINRRLFGSAWKSQFLSGLMFPIMNFVGNLGYAAVAVFGGWKAIHGQINIGDIQAFIQYVQQFNQPIMQISQIASVVQSAAASSERVFEFLAEPDEVPDKANQQPTWRATGDVDFCKVKFSYDNDRPVINDFSAHITAGQKVAIVGPTGAGKTTIVNLLMRFYDPQSGQIMIDGLDIQRLTRADLRRQFAMVLQDTWLFSGTVKENLAYGNLTASDKQIRRAAVEAHVDHFIRSLPQGYDTMLDEEADNISAGEKQLLTIARAILANAPMLILDEATSNVDSRTEILIQKAMTNLMAGRTAFIIAHRLSTIRDADLILVMDHGDIVEQGTHKSLLSRDGFYAKMYNAQFTENTV
jgi:ATP-binding cassette subfamily B protein